MKNIYTTIAIIAFSLALSFTASAQKPGLKRSSHQRMAPPPVTRVSDGTSNTIMVGIRSRRLGTSGTAPDHDIGRVSF